MKTQCTKVYKIDLFERTKCLLAAEQMHVAVERYADKRYLRDDSKYCEYAGPVQ